MAWTVDVATTDHEEASEGIARTFETRLKTSPERRPFVARQRAVGDDTFSASLMSWTGEVECVTEGWQRLALAYVGRAESYTWRMGSESGDGTTPFLVPIGSEVGFEYADIASVSFSFRPEEFLATAGRLLGRDDVRLATTTGATNPTGSPALLRSTMNGFVRDLALTKLALENPLLRAAQFEMLVATTIATLPVIASRATPEGSGPRPVAVRRAMAFIDDHAHLAITVSDVAAAVGLSVRGLQSAFRAATGTTPNGYLRSVRMAAAHDELSASTPERATVAGIAARWGYGNAGRFAGEYRARYGETPFSTLSR